MYGGDKVSKDKCVYDEDKDHDVREFEQAGKSKYLNAGHPMGMGVCAQIVARGLVQRLDSEGGVEVSTRGHMVVSTPKPPTLVFVTADNIYASNQIGFYTQHNITIISPQGCHIELDPSPFCFRFTSSYWFILSLSNKLITQTFGDFNLPTSAFSRYAGLYGLHGGRVKTMQGEKEVTVFHSGRYCEDEEVPHAVLSKYSQGNWVCSLEYR
ncbi:hypothetical protein EON63_19770 [archaeon]|nr:MAG: hypothetical protein EON63_19770 [archaeon]